MPIKHAKPSLSQIILVLKMKATTKHSIKDGAYITTDISIDKGQTLTIHLGGQFNVIDEQGKVTTITADLIKAIVKLANHPCMRDAIKPPTVVPVVQEMTPVSQAVQTTQVQETTHPKTDRDSCKRDEATPIQETKPQPQIVSIKEEPCDSQQSQCIAQQQEATPAQPSIQLPPNPQLTLQDPEPISSSAGPPAVYNDYVGKMFLAAQEPLATSIEKSEAVLTAHPRDLDVEVSQSIGDDASAQHKKQAIQVIAEQVQSKEEVKEETIPSQSKEAPKQRGRKRNTLSMK